MREAIAIGGLSTASARAVAGLFPRVGGALSSETITTREGFERLEPEWDELFRHAADGAHVFQSFNWLWHWANHFLDNGVPQLQPAIVVTRRAVRVVAIWPLVREWRLGLVHLVWMGQPVAQYGDVLVASDDTGERAEIIAAGWRHIRARIRPDIIWLRKVRRDANVAPELIGAGALVSGQCLAPELALGDLRSFCDVLERQTAKARKNRRRLARRLSDRGGLTSTVLEQGPAARDLARLAVSLKRGWLKDRGLLSPAIADPRTAAFFADVAEARVRPAGCRVLTLMSNGEPASIEIGFACKDRLLLHLIVYGLKFERAGVGALHLEDSLRRAFEAGYSACDLLPPAANYKLEWADRSTPVADYAHPMTALGHLYARLYVGPVRNRVKRAVEALPRGLARFIAPCLLLV